MGKLHVGSEDLSLKQPYWENTAYDAEAIPFLVCPKKKWLQKSIWAADNWFVCCMARLHKQTLSAEINEQRLRACNHPSKPQLVPVPQCATEATKKGSSLDVAWNQDSRVLEALFVQRSNKAAVSGDIASPGDLGTL